MTTFVSENPQACANAALEKCVQDPSYTTEELGRDVFRGYELMADQPGDGQIKKIPTNICQTSRGGTLEAVGGDSGTNIGDGEIGDLELVAIGVDQFAGTVDLLWKCLVQSVDDLGVCGAQEVFCRLVL